MSEFKRGDWVTLKPNYEPMKTNYEPMKWGETYIDFGEILQIENVVAKGIVKLKGVRVSTMYLTRCEEPKMTRMQRIERLEKELAELRKLEESDYDPKTWMPRLEEDYWHFEPIGKNNFNQQDTDKAKSGGVLFKTREDAEKYLKDLQGE